MEKGDIVAWLHGRLEEQLSGDETMGELETLVDGCTREIRRQLLERVTQDRVAAEEFGCPQCGRHVKEHLWELAAELHGRGSPEAEQWVRPYLDWLERRKKGALDLIDSLEELQHKLVGLEQSKQEAVAREIGYLKGHKNRMDYKEAKASGQTCGSGAIESTCSQYQRRFKLTGQFWSLAGDEAFLALATLHRNGRWDTLFPHDQQ